RIGSLGRGGAKDAQGEHAQREQATHPVILHGNALTFGQGPASGPAKPWAFQRLREPWRQAKIHTSIPW
ncbi:MAG TPA: hypothetical protein VHN14_17040, partial [Kofleriaceae bacterium]|nr:hypothetical protein [Kofleriaceae bacterium]